MNSFFTKDQQWLDKWDTFLQESERGLYNQLSDWIKSYEVYGFDYTFLIVTVDDKIIGGCGIVIAKALFFKFYCIPCGPVLRNEYEDKVDFILEKLKKDAVKRGCCYFQISLPVVNSEVTFSDYTIKNLSSTSSYFSGESGTKFKYVIPLYGMRLVNLQNKTYDKVVADFSKNHKRNIANSKNETLTFKFVMNPIEIEEGYNCFVLNASEKGYPLRSFESMQKTLNDYIRKDFARMGCCYLNNKIIGAIYIMKTGKRFIYINGGVLKEFQHLNVSHFMHNAVIEQALQLGHKSYDISVGGSPGVIKFKEGFGSDLYHFIDTKHWILKPLTFKMYLLVEKNLRRHKSKVANFLVKAKKFKF